MSDQCFVAFCKNGHIVGCTVNSENHRAEAFKAAAKWAKDGLLVETRTIEFVRESKTLRCPTECYSKRAKAARGKK